MRWPMLTFGASHSLTNAISQTVDKSPITKTGSLAPLPIYWPGPALRCTIVPAIGAKLGVAGSIAPVCSNFSISSSVLPRMRSRLRAASSATSLERTSFSAVIERATRVLHLLERDGLRVKEQTLSLIDDLRQIERRASLVERS